MAEETVNTTVEEPKYTSDPLLNRFFVETHGPVPSKDADQDNDLTTDDTTNAVETTTEPVVETTDDSIDYGKLISEKTGGKFSSLDDVLAAATKEPEYKPLEFINDESKRVYDLIAEGKLSEVADVLSKQNRDYSKYSDIDAVKEDLLSQNPSWDESDVNDFLIDKYGIGEEITEDDRTELTPAQLKEKEARISRNARALARDAKLSKGSLGVKKSDIKLPDLTAKENPNSDILKQYEDESNALNEWVSQLNEGVKSSQSAVEHTYTVDLVDGDSKESYSTSFKIDGKNKEALDGYIKTFLPPLGFEADYVKDGKVDVARIRQEGIDKLFGKQMNQILLKETIAKTKEAVIKGLKNVPDNVGVTVTDKPLTEEEFRIKAIRM